ncbi:MAG TPA: hypothetical protein VFE33_09030 [Thermoanaerobaculia bacterium]|nr:hypothetical protein [Thermoanaerobaculia bacterium]
MPFDERHAPTYTEAIRPALLRVAREHGEPWECRRADDNRMPGSIAKEIITSLHLSDLVIADLSGNNPSVLYELGVAHSAARPTVVITQDIQKLPFDIKDYRALDYNESREGLRSLEERLVRSILDTLSRPGDLTNPVWDFAPIRHPEIILHLDTVRKLEGAVRKEVCLIQPSLVTDMKMFGDIIRDNLARGVRYRYLLPRKREISRQVQIFVEKIGCKPSERADLKIRTVEPHLIESEVVIYDPFDEREEVMIMSPPENAYIFWYRVGKRRGEEIRDRYEFLWENVSEPAMEGSY